MKVIARGKYLLMTIGRCNAAGYFPPAAFIEKLSWRHLSRCIGDSIRTFVPIRGRDGREPIRPAKNRSDQSAGCKRR